VRWVASFELLPAFLEQAQRQSLPESHSPTPAGLLWPPCARRGSPVVRIPGESNAPDGLGDNSRTENSHVFLAPDAMGFKQNQWAAAKVSQHIEAEGVAGVELNEVVR
jgi:hypothetical protein